MCARKHTLTSLWISTVFDNACSVFLFGKIRQPLIRVLLHYNAPNSLPVRLRTWSKSVSLWKKTQCEYENMNKKQKLCGKTYSMLTQRNKNISYMVRVSSVWSGLISLGINGINAWDPSHATISIDLWSGFIAISEEGVCPCVCTEHARMRRQKREKGYGCFVVVVLFFAVACLWLHGPEPCRITFTSSYHISNKAWIRAWVTFNL